LNVEEAVRVWFGFHRPTARQMTHGAASMAVVALVSLTAPFAAAKPLQLVIQPTSDQLAGMDRGSEIVISRRDGSEVWMQIPAPDDNSRIEVKFLFVNKSDKPINVGPEIISSDLISVIPYEKLIEEQKSRETVRKVGHFFLNYVRDRSASSAGTTTATVNYSGMTSNGTIYSGTGTVSVTDPVARQQALERAAEENEIRREQMVQAFQNSRSAIAANLRTTTLMPNYHISGVMTFEIPHALRSASSSKPFTMTVQMGSDRHVLAGAIWNFARNFAFCRISGIPRATYCTDCASRQVYPRYVCSWSHANGVGIQSTGRHVWRQGPTCIRRGPGKTETKDIAEARQGQKG